MLTLFSLCSTNLATVLKTTFFWFMTGLLLEHAATAVSVKAQTGVAPLLLTKACVAPPLVLTGTVVRVSNETELQNAMRNLQPGNTILLANGTYMLSKTLNVANTSNVTIRGASGCDNVVLIGKGMTNSNFGDVPHGIWTNSTNTVIAHLTVRDVYYHPIILNPGAQRPRIYSVRLVNGGQQLIKGNPTSHTEGVDNGLVEYSVMEFEKTSRDHYTNGVDIISGTNWIIRDNLFRNIRAPAGQLAGPAILMWGSSSNTIVERNLFLNTQRGIAFGLQERTPHDHSGGIIRNNIFFRKPGESGDTGVYIADSPNTKVLHNTIILNGTYPNAIEYRFPDTKHVEIRFNLTDGRVAVRDGASGNIGNNITSATSNLFADPANNDLHLVSGAWSAIDRAGAHSDVADDYDGEARPTTGTTPRDIGADEYIIKGGSTSVPDKPTDYEDSAHIETRTVWEPIVQLCSSGIVSGRSRVTFGGLRHEAICLV